MLYKGRSDSPSTQGDRKDRGQSLRDQCGTETKETEPGLVQEGRSKAETLCRKGKKTNT